MTIISRHFFIDNLRITLICMVVICHVSMAYGAPGFWYYEETNTNPVSLACLALLVAVMQTFTLGLFFMISAFFLDKSLKKKSIPQLIRQKSLRLGAPLIFYALVLSPLTIFLASRYGAKETVSFNVLFTEYEWLSLGPLWFVAALMLFTLITLLIKLLKIKGLVLSIPNFPPIQKLIGFGIFLGLLTFFVRIWYPVGEIIQPIGFQLAHFPQYISLFYFGFVASRNDWFRQINYSQGIRHLRVAGVLILVVFPLGTHLGGVLQNGPQAFSGGWNWQSLFYSIWEQLVGIGICIGLIGFFMKKFNNQGPLLQALSSQDYGVYILHALVIVCLTLLARNLEITSSLKFLILNPIVLILSFFISSQVQRIAFLKKIFQ